jgi:hypothetical protein
MNDLIDFETNDTGYIGKLNQNNASLRAAITPLETTLQSIAPGPLSQNLLLAALFGSGHPARIGAGSYAYTISGSVMTLQPGTAWKPSYQQLVASTAVTIIDFSGKPAATYSVAPDATGTPLIFDFNADGLYSVVWTGGAFGTILKTSYVFMTAEEEDALLFSSKYNSTYADLNARLNHIESLLP